MVKLVQSSMTYLVVSCVCLIYIEIVFFMIFWILSGLLTYKMNEEGGVPSLQILRKSIVYWVFSMANPEVNLKQLPLLSTNFNEKIIYLIF